MKKIYALLVASAIMCSFASCSYVSFKPSKDDDSSTDDTTVSAIVTTAAPQEDETTAAQTTASSSGEIPEGFGEKAGETSGKYAPGERFKKIMSNVMAKGKKVNIVLKTEVPPTTSVGAPEMLEITNVIDGKRLAVDMPSSTAHLTVIADKTNNSYKMISHDQKSVMAMTLTAELLKDDDTIFFSEEYDESYFSNDDLFKAGVEKIDGKDYDYDEVTGKDSTVTRYYYEKDAEDLKYIATADSMAEIIKFDNSPDMSIFDIPSDYQELDMASLFEGLGDLGGIEITLPN